MLTLAEAIKTQRLKEFIAQEEARGIEPVDRAELDRALELLIKSPPPERHVSSSGNRAKNSRTEKGTRLLCFMPPI